MSSFAEMMKNLSSVTQSENGGKVYSTVGNPMLDMFSRIGAVRHQPDGEIVSLYMAARQYNEKLADNCILYARDIRNGGLGERRIGRILLQSLSYVNPQKVITNLTKIVDTGRWDDLYCLVDNKEVAPYIWLFIKEQFEKDISNMKQNKSISLMAKWLKSPNTSSAESRRLAQLTYKNLGITEKTYRKTLAALRKYSNVVERTMSDREWEKIVFEHVPSKAMSQYQNSFAAHQNERFEAYKQALVDGKTTINAGTLYPYDIVQKAFKNANPSYGYINKLSDIDEQQWKALPNYVNDNYDVLVLADVSASMKVNNCQPMATSVGLATYFAQRNQSAYHGLYMTFTDVPKIIRINDNWSLDDTLKYVLKTGVGYNTNLDLAFKAIYDMAKEVHEVPKALVVISDMQIDRWYHGDYCDSIVSKWAKKYKEIGLEAPKLILWNVESRGGVSIAPASDNVSYCSGYGIGPFKNLIDLIEMSAWDSMVKILTQPQFTWR